MTDGQFHGFLACFGLVVIVNGKSNQKLLLDIFSTQESSCLFVVRVELFICGKSRVVYLW